MLWFLHDLPRPDAALDAPRRPSLVLLDRDGQPFATFGDVVGDPLRLPDMPPYLPAAAVAVEDHRFYHHHGFDSLGILRAMFVDLTHGHLVQGGSTITQQVAKTLFLSNARTLKRKVQEVMLTIWLEEHFTKREILEIWLNRVYLGSGTWGMDAAARLYFGVSARKVNLWQAAVLAGLPRAPSRFNPRTDPAAAAARGREVLAAMVETGDITAQQAAEAAAQMKFGHPQPNAGWFADYVAGQAGTVVPPNADARLTTTRDSRLQAITEQRLDAMLDGPGAAADATEGAVVILDARSGAIRAMTGGRDYRKSPFNRAVAARRQPGSAFKPFVWLDALEHGATPDDNILDAPLRLGAWSPADYENRYLGDISLTRALEVSSNTAAVRLLLKSGGPTAVADVAHRLGITAALPNDASLALGTGEVTLLDLTAAYAPFFNGGDAITPTGILAVTIDNRTTPTALLPPRRVIDEDRAAAMARMLDAVVAHGTGRAAAIPGKLVGGKTGTTQDSRDAWFIGAVANQLIGVWLGNDDDHPMKNVNGGTLPAQLFRQIAVELGP